MEIWRILGILSSKKRSVSIRPFGTWSVAKVPYTAYSDRYGPENARQEPREAAERSRTDPAFMVQPVVDIVSEE